MREIVLQRLEQRLKEKDDEIHALKKELRGDDDAKSLKERVDALETEVRNIEITLSEVMKSVGTLSTTLDTVLMSMAGKTDGGMQEEDLSVPGGMPPDPQLFDNFAADQKDNKEDGHKDQDSTRFFHLSQNS
ncbi:MAG TPA: hypothetical protein VMC61_02855 [Methanocella sp.]|nr:hypothetical protein [Methanocella sp.]